MHVSKFNIIGLFYPAELTRNKSDLTSHLGVIESADYFSEVKGRNLEDTDADADDGMNPELNQDFDAESDSNLDDDFLAELALELASTGDGKSPGRASKRVQPKALTVIEKVHEIVVYATASPKRQKQMHEIINKTCPEEVKHLFLRKSMRIRWDSVRAELKRALQLRSAITYFVANLDSAPSRQGKSRKIIQKMQARWNITNIPKKEIVSDNFLFWYICHDYVIRVSGSISWSSLSSSGSPYIAGGSSTYSILPGRPLKNLKKNRKNYIKFRKIM
ncbi:hypothetical protein RSAG8_04321, partial [Rhizoctonia solani AG-8 WAC10335]